MRIIEILVVFLSLFVVLGGLAVPLYWGHIEPLIFKLPAYVANITNDITNIINLVMDNFKHV